MTFDLTIPGYNYCGPGTKIKAVLPVNLLDEYCMEHDLFYSNNPDWKSRLVADKVLANRAWKLIYSHKVKFKEKCVALIVCGAITIKRGIYKTVYSMKRH